MPAKKSGLPPANAGRPWLLEVCPASTLKQEGLYEPYNGKTAQHRAQRQHILAVLEESGLLHIESDLHDDLVADADADGLDSVVAAVVAARALPNVHDVTSVPATNEYAVEGYVYT